MNGEIIESAGIKIYKDTFLQQGGRVVLANPAYGWLDKDLNASNHNVFRLDANNEVVWQVQRVENATRASWEDLHRMAREEDPKVLGFFDPFLTLGMEEGAALREEPKGIYREGCVIYLTTRWWAYRLDPETGIATCTGEQVK